jgi:hypothetical protein
VATTPDRGTSSMDTAASAYDVVTTPGHATSFAGASHVPSSTCVADATTTVSGTLADDAEDALTPTLPASGTMLANS